LLFFIIINNVNIKNLIIFITNFIIFIIINIINIIIKKFKNISLILKNNHRFDLNGKIIIIIILIIINIINKFEEKCYYYWRKTISFIWRD
jgi:hypothetical protein